MTDILSFEKITYPSQFNEGELYVITHNDYKCIVKVVSIDGKYIGLEDIFIIQDKAAPHALMTWTFHPLDFKTHNVFATNYSKLEQIQETHPELFL